MQVLKWEDEQQNTAQEVAQQAQPETPKPAEQAQPETPKPIIDHKSDSSSKLEKAINDIEMRSVKRGQLVEATVVKVTNDGLLVDVGQKSEGFIPRAEASTREDIDLPSNFKVGDTISCRIVKMGEDDGMIILSKKRADFELVWDRLKEAKDNKEIIATVATKAVKGGLLVDVGVPAFVPRSQIDQNRNTDPQKWVGKELRVRIIEVDRPTRRVVCSQKDVIEEDKDRRRETFISNLKVGEIYEGTVVGLVEFGAFVDLGEGVEGLIHLSELSWGGRKTPQQLLKKKQKVNVKVIKIAGDEGRISLSLRQAQPHPWELVPYKYSVGDTVEGIVTRILKFGAVVELEEGISGLLHISQVSNHRVERIETEIQEGQKILCKILEIRVPDRKIRLSIKATLPEEPRQERQPRRKFSNYDEEEEQYLKEFVQDATDPTVRFISENDLERENRDILEVDEK